MAVSRQRRDCVHYAATAVALKAQPKRLAFGEIAGFAAEL